MSNEPRRCVQLAGKSVVQDTRAHWLFSRGMTSLDFPAATPTTPPTRSTSAQCASPSKVKFYIEHQRRKQPLMRAAYASTLKRKMSRVIVHEQRWCEQDRANVSVESSTSSDRQQKRSDVHKNSVDRTVLPTDDWHWQQNADAALVSGYTDNHWRTDHDTWLYPHLMTNGHVSFRTSKGYFSKQC